MTYLFMIGVLYIPKVTLGSKLDFQIIHVENMRINSVTTQIWSKFTFFIHISFNEKNSCIDFSMKLRILAQNFMLIQEMEEKIGVTILLFSKFWHKPQNKQKIAFFDFKSKIVTRQKNFCKKCDMIFDLLAISNKSWTFEADPRWSENCVFRPDYQKIAFSDPLESQFLAKFWKIIFSWFLLYHSMILSHF